MAAVISGDSGNSFAWYVSYLWQGEGPVLLLAAAATLWGVYRRSKGVLLVSVMAVAYLLFISVFAVHAERTALPLIPLVSLLAAALACELGLRWAGDGAAGCASPRPRSCWSPWRCRSPQRCARRSG